MNDDFLNDQCHFDKETNVIAEQKVVNFFIHNCKREIFIWKIFLVTFNMIFFVKYHLIAI